MGNLASPGARHGGLRAMGNLASPSARRGSLRAMGNLASSGARHGGLRAMGNLAGPGARHGGLCAMGNLASPGARHGSLCAICNWNAPALRVMGNLASPGARHGSLCAIGNWNAPARGTAASAQYRQREKQNVRGIESPRHHHKILTRHKTHIEIGRGALAAAQINNKKDMGSAQWQWKHNIGTLPSARWTEVGPKRNMEHHLSEGRREEL
jgi:hypothetical protein